MINDKVSSFKGEIYLKKGTLFQDYKKLREMIPLLENEVNEGRKLRASCKDKINQLRGEFYEYHDTKIEEKVKETNELKEQYSRKEKDYNDEINKMQGIIANLEKEKEDLENQITRVTEVNRNYLLALDSHFENKKYKARIRELEERCKEQDEKLLQYTEESKEFNSAYRSQKWIESRDSDIHVDAIGRDQDFNFSSSLDLSRLSYRHEEEEAEIGSQRLTQKLSHRKE